MRISPGIYIHTRRERESHEKFNHSLAPHIDCSSFPYSSVNNSLYICISSLPIPHTLLLLLQLLRLLRFSSHVPGKSFSFSLSCLSRASTLLGSISTVCRRTFHLGFLSGVPHFGFGFGSYPCLRRCFWFLVSSF